MLADVQNRSADSAEFRAALEAGDLASLRRIPKTDLHIHSLYGTRIESIEAWVRQPLPRPPGRMTSLDEMRDYGHQVLYPHIFNRAGFEFTATSAIRDSIEDGVVRLEMSLDVRFMSMYEAVPTGFLDFVARLARTHADRIDFRPEIGVSRDRPPATEIPLAMICIDSGLFRSLDLYGNETAVPPESYRSLYEHARALKKKVHVGEFGNADLMERTIDLLEPDEIQHGVAAATSPRLMERLRRDRIRLNVCPTSNVCLGVVPAIGVHPIRSLLDRTFRRFCWDVGSQSIV